MSGNAELTITVNVEAWKVSKMRRTMIQCRWDLWRWQHGWLKVLNGREHESPSARHDVGCTCSGCTQRRPTDDINCTGYCGKCGRTIDDHELTREGHAIRCPKVRR